MPYITRDDVFPTNFAYHTGPADFNGAVIRASIITTAVYIRPIERFIERNRLTISAREKRTLVKYIFVGVVRGTTEWEIGVGRIVVVVVNEKIVRVINIASRKTTIIIFVFEKRLAATYVQRI